MSIFTEVDRFHQNIQYAIRVLTKARSFTLITVLTLALGIAVNTTIFSLVSAVILRKPAVEKPDRLMMIVGVNAPQGLEREPLTANDVKAIQEHDRVFQTVAVFTDLTDATTTGYAEPAHLQAMSVSANYFRVLGVSATLGRTFLPDEDQPGHEHVILLSHDLWEQRFASDPHIIGKSVLIDGHPETVIGVMPARLKVAILPPQFWMPLILHVGAPQSANDEPRPRSLYALARLAPGASVDQAKAETAVIASEIERSSRTRSKGWSATAIPLQQYLIDASNMRPALIILMGQSALFF